MASEEINLRQLVARLNTPRFTTYLVARGWKEKPSRYSGQVYFEVESGDGSNAYDLYLPVSAEDPKYHTRLMRAIYKLCGIEDREPGQIAQDLLASTAIPSRPEQCSTRAIRLRLVNSGLSPLRIRVDAPFREVALLPEEAIELKSDDATIRILEIGRENPSLTVLVSGPE